MAQYVGTAMLVSSTSCPDAGKIGDLVLTGPGADGPYDVWFVFVYTDDGEKAQTIRDHGMAVRRGNTLTFTHHKDASEHVFELVEWEMF
ncbi:MAG: hypothetical protein ACOYIK_01700 [Coriobacteriales bacterium]|jgi:hypothetical protein